MEGMHHPSLTSYSSPPNQTPTPIETTDTVPTLECMIGWPSKETHMALRETPEFMDTVKTLRAIALPPVPGKGMFHVKMQGKKP